MSISKFWSSLTLKMEATNCEMSAIVYRWKRLHVPEDLYRRHYTGILLNPSSVDSHFPSARFSYT